MQYDKNKYLTQELKSDVIRNTLYNYTLSDPKIAVIPKTMDKKYIYIGVAAIIIIIIVNNK